MILLDRRIGSKELLPLFKPYGIEVELTELEFGDLCWSGNGPDNGVLVGVERKTIHDLISSMRSRRLSGHQLPGLLRTYDYVYLLVEGITRCGDKGELLTYYKRGFIPVRSGSRPILYREVEHYFETLTHICGVTVVSTANDEQTVLWSVSAYKWWNDKRWDQHHAHKEIYAPPPKQKGGRVFGRSKIGIVEKVAAQIVGIDRRAFDVGKKFKTVRDMVNASEKDWEKVKGIGKVLAGKIYRQLRS